MIFPVAVTALVLAMSIASPAFAAMPGSLSLRDVAWAPTEAVQYQVPRQRQDRSRAYDYRNGHNSYASQNGTPAAGSRNNRDVIPGWPCVYRNDARTYSAYPSWEICN